MNDFDVQREPLDRDQILNHPPTASEVEAALARLLRSDRFVRNGNAARFLKFVVEETLAGRGDRLKAYTIATLALGRPDDFDPQADSIVRVQAARVRGQIEEYYASQGAGDPLRIELAKGSYQPTFAWIHASPLPPVDSSPPEIAPQPMEQPATQKPVSRRRTLDIAAAILGAIVLLAVLIAVPWRGNSDAERAPRFPVLAVLVARAPNDGAPISEAAVRLMSQIETAASASDYVGLRRHAAVSAGVDYELEARFSASKSQSFDVDFALIHKASSDVVWSTQYQDVSAADFNRLDALGKLVAGEVSDVGGALLADDLRRFKQEGAPRTGLYCELSALDSIRAGGLAELGDARACLEKQVARAADDAPTLSLLSTLLVIQYFDRSTGSLGERDLQRATQLARRAYDVNPRRTDSLAALFYARFANKRYEDAFEFASSLQQTDRSAVLVELRLGRAYISRACYDEGARMLGDVEAKLRSPQPTATAFLGLAAFMRDDAVAVRRFTTRYASKFSPIGLLIGMIDCHRSGDVTCVAAKRETLKASFPGVYSDLDATFDRYGLAPEIVDRLEAELPALGFASRQALQGKKKDEPAQASFCRS